MYTYATIALAFLGVAHASDAAVFELGECRLENTAGSNTIVVDGSCEFVDSAGHLLYASSSRVAALEAQMTELKDLLRAQIGPFANDPPTAPPPPATCIRGLTAADPISGPSEYSTVPGECPSRTLYYSVPGYDGGAVFQAYTDCSITEANTNTATHGSVPVACITMLYHRHFEADSWADADAGPNILPHHLMAATHSAYMSEGLNPGFNVGYVLKDQGTLLAAMCANADAGDSQIFVGQYDYQTGTDLSSATFLNYIRFPGKYGGNDNVDGSFFVELFNKYQTADQSPESYHICFQTGYCRNPFYQTGHHTNNGVVQMGAHHGNSNGNREVCFEHVVEQHGGTTDSSHTWAVWGDCQTTCTSSCFARETGLGSGDRIGFVGVTGC